VRFVCKACPRCFIPSAPTLLRAAPPYTRVCHLTHPCICTATTYNTQQLTSYRHVRHGVIRLQGLSQMLHTLGTHLAVTSISNRYVSYVTVRAICLQGLPQMLHALGMRAINICTMHMCLPPHTDPVVQAQTQLYMHRPSYTGTDPVIQAQMYPVIQARTQLYRHRRTQLYMHRLTYTGTDPVIHAQTQLYRHRPSYTGTNPVIQAQTSYTCKNPVIVFTTTYVSPLRTIHNS